MRTFFMTPLVIFFLLIIIMMAKLLDSDTHENIALLNQKLPEFNLPAVYENIPGLANSDIKGKYSLLNIFASWCITCKLEHPFLLSLSKEGVIPVYGIAWKDNPENLSKWLKEKGNPYVAIGADNNGKAIIDLSVTGAPETFLISPEGIVLLRYAGPINEDIWRKKFLPLMEK